MILYFNFTVKPLRLKSHIMFTPFTIIMLKSIQFIRKLKFQSSRKLRSLIQSITQWKYHTQSLLSHMLSLFQFTITQYTKNNTLPITNKAITMKEAIPVILVKEVKNGIKHSNSPCPYDSNINSHSSNNPCHPHCYVLSPHFVNYSLNHQKFLI